MDLAWNRLCFIIVVATYSITKATAIECHECMHIEVSSSDEHHEKRLDGFIEDANCAKHGEDYTTKRTVTCPYHCEKDVGKVTIKFDGTSSTMDIIARRCSIIPVDDICLNHDDEVEDIFKYHFGNFDATFDSKNFKSCYCDTDLCNHSNIIQGKLMTTITMLLFLLLIQV